MLANDEHDFFRLYLTSGLADLEQMLRDADFSGDVAGYLTKAADEKIAATFQQSRFNPIAITAA